MRPHSLDEVIGQRHLTGPGTPFRKLIDHDAAMSLLLWGPPGTGKTTLAHVVSEVTKRRFTELSAVTAGVKDVRAAIEAARRELGLNGAHTILFIDEVTVRAIDDERGLGDRYTLPPYAADHLILLAVGDARRALNYLESAAL